MAKRQRGATRLHHEPVESRNVAAVAVKLIVLAVLIGGVSWGAQLPLTP